jgi:hypothetical protein
MDLHSLYLTKASTTVCVVYIRAHIQDYFLLLGLLSQDSTLNYYYY